MGNFVETKKTRLSALSNMEAMTMSSLPASMEGMIAFPLGLVEAVFDAQPGGDGHGEVVVDARGLLAADRDVHLPGGVRHGGVATWMVPADLMAAGSMAFSVESAFTLAMLKVVAELALVLGLALALAAPLDVELDPQAARTTASSATTTVAATSDRLLVFLMTLPLVMASIIGIVKAL